MTKSHNKPGNSGRRKFIIGVSVAGLLAVAGTSGATAFTPNVVREVGHFVECFGWMITDPARHADNCLPGQVPPLESLVSSGPGEPTPPPPEQEEDRTVIDSDDLT